VIERIFIFIVEAIVGVGFIIFVVGGVEATIEVMKCVLRKE